MSHDPPPRTVAALAAPPRDLELSPAAMRQLVSEAMDRICSHLESLPEQPAADARDGASLARSLVEPLPERGTPFQELLDLLFDRLVPHSFNTAGPGYLAYVPGGGLFHAALADLIAGSVNRYAGVFAAAPGLVQLEANVVRWFCDLVGLPPSSGGFLTSGGSLANFSAVVAARRDRLGERFLDGTLYLSDQTHHSVAKAALLAGFPEEALRVVPSGTDLRIRLDALEEAIAADRRRGRRPFLLAANAGTTNSGAVDPLPELAEVARREGLWLHVDAAYGGFFLLTERGRGALRGIERADSVVLDPHKGLFLPYGSGALVARDAETLRRAHRAGADYLPAMQEAPDLVDFCALSPELSRPFRGLAVWLPLRLHGAGPFRQYLEEKLALKDWIRDRLVRLPGVRLVADSPLSTLAFAVDLPGRDSDELDELTLRLMEGVNRRKRVYLTGTRLHGRRAIRICVLSFRTHLDRLEACLEDVQAVLGELA